jgi:hypothetical protein
MNQLFLPAVAFSSILCLCKYFQNKNNHNSNKELSSFHQIQQKFLYLQLYIPIPGSQGMSVSIQNDFIIGQAIKGRKLTPLPLSHIK